MAVYLGAEGVQRLVERGTVLNPESTIQESACNAVPLVRDEEGDGRLYLSGRDVRVDGRMTKLLFDSGATYLWLHDPNAPRGVATIRPVSLQIGNQPPVTVQAHYTWATQYPQSIGSATLNQIGYSVVLRRDGYRLVPKGTRIVAAARIARVRVDGYP